jgi:hypothetical protein
MAFSRSLNIKSDLVLGGLILKQELSEFVATANDVAATVRFLLNSDGDGIGEASMA